MSKCMTFEYYRYFMTIVAFMMYSKGPIHADIFTYKLTFVAINAFIYC